MNRMLTFAACAGMVLSAGAFAHGMTIDQPANPETAPAANPDAKALPPIPTPPPAPVADGEEFPTGMAIMQRAVQARGGLDAWKKHDTIRVSGTFAMEMMGLEGPVVVNMKQPAAMNVHITLTGMGEVVQAAKGDVAWMSQPGMAMQVVDGEFGDQLKQQADFLAPFEPNRVVESATVTAIEPVRGTPAYRVEIKEKAGEASVRWFAVDSGYMLRKATYDENGVIASDTYYSDYQRFGDIIHPTATEVRGQMGTQKLTMQKVEYGVEMDSELFTPPGEL